MKEIALWLLDELMSTIPRILLRIFYPPKKIAGQVRIDLRGEKPISPSLGSSIPRLDLYFEITNLSNLDLTLDRMLLDLWFGQPLLNGAILRRHPIPARSTTQDIHFRSDLTTKQIQQIEPYLRESPPSGSITLGALAYFESKVGVIEVENR
ncbi:MAG: hypothetical protein U9Q78_01080 [Chloroflexota bacterium]|nr:hypothetical protein [Chloroflexota bacterium]